MTLAAALVRSTLWTIPVGLIFAVVQGVLKGTGHPWLAAQAADFATFTAGTVWGWFWSKSDHA